MLTPTTERFRGLARSSPWRWRALSFDLHRRPLHGPEHSVRTTVVRPGRLRVVSPTGEVHEVVEARPGTTSRGGTRRGSSAPLPYPWEVPVELDADGFVRRRRRWSTADDPMWQDYQFVAMLDPVELADASCDVRSGVDPVDRRPDAVPPPALDVHRLEAGVRLGRATWWAEVSPTAGYDPRCTCCPLLWGAVSEALDAACSGRRGPLSPGPDAGYPSAHLVGLDVATGVCVHVEHLDGRFPGRGFSVDVLAVDAAVRAWG